MIGIITDEIQMTGAFFINELKANLNVNMRISIVVIANLRVFTT